MKKRVRFALFRFLENRWRCFRQFGDLYLRVPLCGHLALCVWVPAGR